MPSICQLGSIVFSPIKQRQTKINFFVNIIRGRDNERKRAVGKRGRERKGVKHREKERQREGKTERQINRKTERQKDRKTERQKDRKTERQNPSVCV